MLPVNPGGHAAYQNFVITNLRKYYSAPDIIYGLPGISLNGSGILIFLIPMNLFVQNTLSLVRSQGFLPVCSVSYLLSIDFKIRSPELTGQPS